MIVEIRYFVRVGILNLMPSIEYPNTYNGTYVPNKLYYSLIMFDKKNKIPHIIGYNVINSTD